MVMEYCDKVQGVIEEFARGKNLTLRRTVGELVPERIDFYLEKPDSPYPNALYSVFVTSNLEVMVNDYVGPGSRPDADLLAKRLADVGGLTVRFIDRRAYTYLDINPSTK